jgi:hypothetical protein
MRRPDATLGRWSTNRECNSFAAEGNHPWPQRRSSWARQHNLSAGSATLIPEEIRDWSTIASAVSTAGTGARNHVTLTVLRRSIYDQERPSKEFIGGLSVPMKGCPRREMPAANSTGNTRIHAFTGWNTYLANTTTQTAITMVMRSSSNAMGKSLPPIVRTKPVLAAYPPNVPATAPAAPNTMPR